MNYEMLFCKSFLLIFMQIDGGVVGPLAGFFNPFQHSEVAGQFLAKEACRSAKLALLY
jgi:hypothetical protein